ncbi:VTT domain-containing protein [Paucibacter sp. O1-1]|uniref:VTT domain-containing protein n=1 Tax=Paucibacter sp. M5-1 TaxID=3015998 RepID=UPI0021D4D0B6|nr:VTT domain-containing protein [Paucibacter sp. M5-1]MCU7373928.1 VTT domain-containing protein [Paucibacter sp. O1-1]MCZ7880236.1 VTT domain-containing protein [Paucibacter sp. M5-1]MDA3828930.1 VTT domain-containing protein [Paucibacter sp. O1-1]
MRSLIELLVAHGVLLVFLVTLAARAGAPLPAAPLLVVAGGLAAEGTLSGWAVLVVAVLANIAGDAVWFVAGQRQGHRVMKLLCRISLSPDACVRQSEGLILRWGGRALLAAKFLPGVSVVAAPMAGALGMSWRRFIAYDFVAGLLWSGAFVLLGLMLSDQIQQVLDMLAGAGYVALAALALIVAGLILRRWWQRRRFARRTRGGRRISIAEAAALQDRGEAPVFIDVRAAGGRAVDPRHIPGALLLEIDQIKSHAASLPRDRELILYCNCPNEVTAALAVTVLAEAGVTRARALVGGLDGWVGAGRAVAGA